MSEPITVQIPHRLGAQEAKRRIQQGFVQLAEQIGGPGIAKVNYAWDGDRMTFSIGLLAQVISGQLGVTTDAVCIEVQLPGLLAGFANGIGARLKKQGQLLLEKK